MRYISTDYIKAIMKNDRLMQGNAEYTLWEQEVNKRVDAMPFLDIVQCKECKYESICSHSVQHTTHEPTSVTIGYKLVNSCDYGERRE